MESIVFDLETTGLSGDDEIVQISVIDGEGNTLIDSLVKPTQHTSWTEAERIHGISPEMVEDAPTAEDLMPKVRKIFSSAEK